jgi:carbamoyl-phosphate synthase large subunit
MRIVRGPEELEVHEPSLVDEYLEGALELDVDLLCDAEDAWVAGILEHIEPAGIHSGDSACVIPGPSVTGALEDEVTEIARELSRRLQVRGLLNLQLAVKDGEVAVIEANPRASRTVPFIAKATGIHLVDLACRLMLGERLAELSLPERARPTRAWAKEAIFPEDRFPGAADRAPEMRSTGEVMAGGNSPVDAYRRVLRASGRSQAPGAVGPSLQELASSLGG